MAKGLLIVAALGAVGLGAAMALKKAGDVITGKSGKSWRVVMLPPVGNVKTYEVFAPQASFGPHAEMSVLRYSQTGSDMASRKIVGIGSGVPESIAAVAASDFGLPFNASLMPTG